MSTGQERVQLYAGQVPDGDGLCLWPTERVPLSGVGSVIAYTLRHDLRTHILKLHGVYTGGCLAHWGCCREIKCSVYP